MVVGDFTYSPVYLRRYGDLAISDFRQCEAFGLSP